MEEEETFLDGIRCFKGRGLEWLTAVLLKLSKDQVFKKSLSQRGMKAMLPQLADPGQRVDRAGSWPHLALHVPKGSL